MPNAVAKRLKASDLPQIDDSLDAVFKSGKEPTGATERLANRQMELIKAALKDRHLRETSDNGVYQLQGDLR